MSIFEVLFYQFCHVVFVAVKYTVCTPDNVSRIGRYHTDFYTEKHWLVGAVVGYVAKYDCINVVFIP